MHNERMCLAALRGAIQEANEVQRKNRARERGEVALFIMQRLPMTLKQIFNSADRFLIVHIFSFLLYFAAAPVFLPAEPAGFF